MYTFVEGISEMSVSLHKDTVMRKKKIFLKADCSDLLSSLAQKQAVLRQVADGSVGGTVQQRILKAREKDLYLASIKWECFQQKVTENSALTY